jgi:pimeloyl-ACP methyl ester carboxylesterase
VLVHALGASWELWRPVLPALAARRDVIAVDLPGFGASAPVAECSVPAFADEVEAALDELGVGVADVAGNSMGGWIALELARRGRAKTAVAISPAGMGGGVESRVSNAWVAVMRAMAGPAAAAAPWLAKRAWGRGLLASGMFARPGGLEPAYLVGLAQGYAAAPAFDATRRWLFEHRAEGLDEIDVPVLIAWGSRDLLLPPRQGYRFAAAIPRSELRVLEGLGHSPMGDDPAQVAEMILEFTDG